MITLLSPSKKLNFKNQESVPNFTQCDFINSAQELVNKAKNLSSEDLKDLMKISDSLANLNKERFNAWSQPFTRSNSKQAILAFDGGVYSGLEAESFDKKDLEFAQNHLRILSGLYGVLRPLDLIQPYRLEMGIKFKNKRGKNLYDFWKNDVTDNLNNSLKQHDNHTVLNCASNEYFNVVDQKRLNGKILNIVFKEYREGQLKFISFNAKKARGLLAKFVINNQLNNNNDLKDFNLDNYKFDSSLSDESTYVFTK